MTALPKTEKQFPVKQIMPHLSQPLNGYRYSSDAVILATFAAQKPTSVWADLGTGCGVLGVRILQSWPRSIGLAIEQSKVAHEHARKNLGTSSVTLVRGDLRSFPWKMGQLDLVVCNPPYYDHNAFRKSLDPGIREARHALSGDIVDFAMVLKSALKPDGRFCFVFPVALVTPKLETLRSLGFYIQRRLEIRSFCDREAHCACLELALRPAVQETEDLTLYETPGFYRREAWEFLTMVRSG